MQFLYPSVLWALTALVIPILVHLFNFRRARLVRFSNVRFLENVKKQTTRTRNIKHLLILLCRLMLLLFLILAFAQPFIPGKEVGLQGSQVTLYVDNSMSMSNITPEDIDGLASAVNLAEQVVLAYPDNVQFKLITNDFAPSSNHFRSKELILDEILELRHSNVPRGGSEIFSRVFREESLIGEDYFFLSDFQRSTYESLNKRTDSLSSMHLLPIAFDAYDNIYIDSVYLKTPFVISGQPNSINAVISNHSRVPKKDIIVKLLINDRQNSSLSVDIQANASTEVSFELTAFDQENTGKIVIEDYPLVFDNEFYFTFNVSSGIRVVEIKESPGITPIEKVYSNSDLFDFSSYQKGNISYDDVQKADLLIINAIEALDNGLISQINNKLDNDRSVLLIPSALATEENLSKTLSYPATIETGIEKESLEVPNVMHPFFENIFEKVDKKSVLPSASILAQAAGPKDVLLSTKTGKPFLTQLYAKGSYYFMACPLEVEFTDFHRNSLIVPVLQRIAEKSSKNNQSLYFNIGDRSFVVKDDALNSNALYKIKQGNDEIVIPQQIQGNALTIDPPKYLLNPGYYDLINNEQPIYRLAINHDRAESLLASMDTDEIREKFSGFDKLEVYENATLENFSKTLKEKYDKIELWKYALILSLMFLALEVVLIRFL